MSSDVGLIRSLAALEVNIAFVISFSGAVVSAHGLMRLLANLHVLNAIFPSLLRSIKPGSDYLFILTENATLENMKNTAVSLRWDMLCTCKKTNIAI